MSISPTSHSTKYFIRVLRLIFWMCRYQWEIHKEKHVTQRFQATKHFRTHLNTLKTFLESLFAFFVPVFAMKCLNTTLSSPNTDMSDFIWYPFIRNRMCFRTTKNDVSVRFWRVSVSETFTQHLFYLETCRDTQILKNNVWFWHIQNINLKTLITFIIKLFECDVGEMLT